MVLLLIYVQGNEMGSCGGVSEPGGLAQEIESLEDQPSEPEREPEESGMRHVIIGPIPQHIWLNSSGYLVACPMSPF